MKKKQFYRKCFKLRKHAENGQYILNPYFVILHCGGLTSLSRCSSSNMRVIIFNHFKVVIKRVR